MRVRIIKGRVMTYIALAIVAVAFISLIVITALSVGRREQYDSYKVSINGRYSVDGGEWQDTIPDEMLHSDFHSVTIKGTLSRPMYYYESYLIIVTNNIWYRIETPEASSPTTARTIPPR